MFATQILPSRISEPADQNVCVFLFVPSCDSGAGKEGAFMSNLVGSYPLSDWIGPWAKWRMRRIKTTLLRIVKMARCVGFEPSPYLSCRSSYGKWSFSGASGHQEGSAPRRSSRGRSQRTSDWLARMTDSAPTNRESCQAPPELDKIP